MSSTVCFAGRGVLADTGEPDWAGVDDASGVFLLAPSRAPPHAPYIATSTTSTPPCRIAHHLEDPFASTRHLPARDQRRARMICLGRPRESNERFRALDMRP